MPDKLGWDNNFGNSLPKRKSQMLIIDIHNTDGTISNVSYFAGSDEGCIWECVKNYIEEEYNSDNVKLVEAAESDTDQREIITVNSKVIGRLNKRRS